MSSGLQLRWREARVAAPRLKVLVTALSVASLALCAQGPPAASAARRSKPKQPPPSLSVAHPIYAATKAETAMHRNFDAAHGLLDEGSGGARYAYAWSTSQALAADIAVAKASGSPAALAQVHRDLTGLSHYWDGAASPPGYDCVGGAPARARRRPVLRRQRMDRARPRPRLSAHPRTCPACSAPKKSSPSPRAAGTRTRGTHSRVECSGRSPIPTGTATRSAPAARRSSACSST